MAHRQEYKFGLPMRPAHEVMLLSRLGSHYPTRLSFMRTLTRHMLRHRWRIERTRFEVNRQGHGEITYTLTTPNGLFTFVAFSHKLDANERTDRVIADKWDLTATLCAGPVSPEHMDSLRENVPKQEAGRLDYRSLIMTRANKSSRNFQYVADRLASGQQPEPDAIARLGYLYRTTAVYGSGKFGMSDWSSLKEQHSDFARPFAAEMFTCYMLRQLSFDLVEHLACQTGSDVACNLDDDIKRYFGIGNATGLGMAPFLICHPMLINQWITGRETALARIRSKVQPTEVHLVHLTKLLSRARTHLLQTMVASKAQQEINTRAASELSQLVQQMPRQATSFEPLIDAARSLSTDTQEILISCLLELSPELVDSIGDAMGVDETFDIRPEQSLEALKTTLEHYYDWALAIDFGRAESHRTFWYRSAEKMQPRLGEAGVDEGMDRQLNLDIARQAHGLHEHICDHIVRNPQDRVAHFLIQFPALRYIVRRIQTMALTTYGEIRANLLDENITPTDLMRCKLSMLGSSKFDPHSRLCVRNTMFQGAPILADLEKAERLGSSTDQGVEPHLHTLDDWSFPLMPVHHASV